MDGGAWWAAVHGVTKSQTRLNNFTFMHWRRKWQPTPVFLPGESQGRGSLVAAVSGVTQSRTQLKRLSSSSSRTALLHEFFLGLGWSGSNYLGHNLPVKEERNAGKNKQSHSMLPGPTGNWCSHFFHIHWPKWDVCPTETNPWWGTFTLPGKPEQRGDLEEKGGRENLLRNHRSQGTRFRIWS